MNAEIFTVYAAHGDGGNEYRQGPVIAVCSTRAQAEAVAKNAGWYGGDGGVTEMAAIKINGEVYALRNRHPVDLDGHEKARREMERQKAIAKLTPDELAALGLKV